MKLFIWNRATLPEMQSNIQILQTKKSTLYVESTTAQASVRPTELSSPGVLYIALFRKQSAVIARAEI